MIGRCTCNNDKFGNTSGADYQNKIYGVGNRVFTIGTKEVRCSVCGKSYPKPGGVEKELKKGAAGKATGSNKDSNSSSTANTSSTEVSSSTPASTKNKR